WGGVEGRSQPFVDPDGIESRLISRPGTGEYNVARGIGTPISDVDTQFHATSPLPALQLHGQDNISLPGVISVFEQDPKIRVGQSASERDRIKSLNKHRRSIFRHLVDR